MRTFFAVLAITAFTTISQVQGVNLQPVEGDGNVVAKTIARNRDENVTGNLNVVNERPRKIGGRTQSEDVVVSDAKLN